MNKIVCLSYLKISDPLPKIHLFFYLALAKCMFNFAQQADTKLCDTLMVSLKDFEKLILKKKNSAVDKKKSYKITDHAKSPCCLVVTDD